MSFLYGFRSLTSPQEPPRQVILGVEWTSWLLIAWVTHYFHQSIIFTWKAPRLNDSNLSIVFSAMVFNLFNGYYNGWESACADTLASGFSWTLFGVGWILFGFGMGVNIYSDYYLFALRRKKLQLESQNKTKDPQSSPPMYFIPMGSLYRWISCPNYFG
jgi:hypothetical protein